MEINETKKQIKISHIVLEILIICTVFLGAYFSSDTTKQVINVIAFLIAFLASIYMHRFFFPFILLSVTCYLLASVQELYSSGYVYLPITKILWSIGNYTFPIGIVHFIYKLMFEFKIEEKDG